MPHCCHAWQTYKWNRSLCTNHTYVTIVGPESIRKEMAKKLEEILKKRYT
jgi:hypothetical protein